MKSFITILAAMVLTTSSFATPPGFARLTIVNVENKNLRIVIDGNRYDHIGNNLSLGNLNMGYHNIRIYQIRRGLFADDRLIYSSSIFLKPERQMSLIVNRSGDVAINEQSGRWDDRGRDQRDDRYDGRGRDSRDDRSDNRDQHDRNDRRNGGWGNN